MVNDRVPHNSDARQPQDIGQWPLAIVVDLSYASTVLRAWGPKTFAGFVREKSKDSYYRGVEGDEDERHDRRSGCKAPAVKPADQPTCEDMDMVDVVLALWMRAAREAAAERRPPSSDAPHIAHNKNKIQTWLQSIEDSEESTA